MFALTDERHSIISALSPRALSGNTTISGLTIDTLGLNGLAFQVQTGAGALGSTNATVLLFESDNANMSGETAAKADFIIGSLPTLSANNATYQFGYNPSKRYVRIKIDGNAGSAVLVAATSVGRTTTNS